MRRLLIALAFVSTGCLGRTGLSAEDLAAFDGDGAALDDTAITIIDSDPIDTGTAVTDTGTRDTFIDIWEVFPIPDGGPIGECASCVRDKCGDRVNACINDPACRAGLACTVTRCLGGGGPGGFDLACVAGCFGGDISKAGVAISTFTCVLGTCGSACGGLLGGGGGGFPGGGGGTPSTDAGKPGMGFKDFTPAELKSLPSSTRFVFSPEAFHPWAHEIRTSACEQKLISCAP
jgi:hypothetical protein